MKNCRDCGNELNDSNWPDYRKKNYDYICNDCIKKYRKGYAKKKKLGIPRTSSKMQCPDYVIENHSIYGKIAKIKLNEEYFTIVDLIDADWLNKDKWTVSRDVHTNYASRFEGKKYLLMHREIIKRVLIEEKNIDLFVDFISNPRKYPVDHKNGDGLLNLRSNLRVVSARQNSQNRHHKRSSKYPGVHFDSNKHKWVSKFKHENEYHFIGYFDDEVAAFEAYKLKIKEVTGEKVILER